VCAGERGRTSVRPEAKKQIYKEDQPRCGSAEREGEGGWYFIALRVEQANQDIDIRENSHFGSGVGSGRSTRSEKKNLNQ
jgi:hypothetical protein